MHHLALPDVRNFNFIQPDHMDIGHYGNGRGIDLGTDVDRRYDPDACIYRRHRPDDNRQGQIQKKRVRQSPDVYLYCFGSDQSYLGGIPGRRVHRILPKCLVLRGEAKWHCGTTDR